jgi:serine/threonine protein phosphatase PrpC
LKVATASDIGLIRKVNEDSLVVRIVDEARPFLLAAVADGVGGNAGGDIASALAVAAFEREVLDRAPVPAGTFPETLSWLHAAVLRAHRAIRDEAVCRPELAGMASTLTAALLIGRDLHVAHVGDSRAYVKRRDTLSRISRDHSLVAELVEAGSLTSDEARRHPQRNVITRALGSGEEPQAELGCVRLEEGDLVLLCTDGLTAVLSDVDLNATMGPSAGAIPAMVERLIAAARDRGGPDNTTVILIRVGDDPAPVDACDRRDPP